MSHQQLASLAIIHLMCTTGYIQNLCIRQSVTCLLTPNSVQPTLYHTQSRGLVKWLGGRAYAILEWVTQPPFYYAAIYPQPLYLEVQRVEKFYP